MLLGLGAVLSAIGFVQMRWIDEVAKAQRQHAATAIQTAVARFTSDFDAEITRAHLAFEIPGLEPDTPAGLGTRLAIWRELAPYPKLILDVTLTKTSPAAVRHEESL